jgi:hypothetical protein
MNQVKKEVNKPVFSQKELKQLSKLIENSAKATKATNTIGPDIMGYHR